MAGQQQVPPRQAWGLSVLTAAIHAKSPSLGRLLARPGNQAQASGLGGGVPVLRPPRGARVAPPNEAAAADSAPNIGTGTVHLKDRTFRIGTWNTRGKTMAKPGLALVNKVTAAEDIMSVENIDLLVLTETHTDDTHPVTTSHQHVILAQTGISTASARVAILAPNDGSWSCLEALTIIPGHAILAQLNHCCSTETFWLLAVYGDVSGRHTSLLTFYQELHNFLADFIYSPEHSTSWSGCLAAGDWNAVEHPKDRAPPAVPTSLHSRIKSTFAHIRTLCHLQDAAGQGACPQGHTFSGTRLTSWTSRIDWIYHPQDSWWANRPTVIPTLWSDHKLIWAECGITAPQVQIAKAAPCLPNMDELAKNKKDFWGPVLEKYSMLANGTVTLETWTAFKKAVLTLGMKARRTQRGNRSAEWRAALRGDTIPLEELPAALDCHVPCHFFIFPFIFIRSHSVPLFISIFCYHLPSPCILRSRTPLPMSPDSSPCYGFRTSHMS